MLEADQVTRLTTRLIIRLTPSEKRRLKAEADRQGTSVSQLVRDALFGFAPVRLHRLQTPGPGYEKNPEKNS